VKQLTLEQAIGQKLMLSFIGTEPSPDFLATLQRQHVGGVTLFRHDNVIDPPQVRRLTAALQRAAAASGQPPLLIAADQEGGQLMTIDGGATRFPGNMALGATGSADLAYQTGYALGRELAAMGVNVNYAPCCDVNSNPQNPVVGARSFGEDPALVAQLGAAMVRGLQAAGVAATAKHFPGHGDTATDSHHHIPIIRHDRDRVWQVEFPPFAAAIEAGVQIVMTAHVAFPAFDDGLLLPATLSPALLRGLLRTELEFAGVILSDALDMAAFSQGDLVIDTLASAAAGIDLLLLNADATTQQNVYTGLLQAAQRTLLSPKEVIASAERVLALKRWLAQTPLLPLEVVGSAEHQALAFETAARSVTLVRDDARLLPLRLAPDARLAVIVPQPVDLTPADTSSYVNLSLARDVRAYHAATDEFVVPADPTATDIDGLRQRLDGYDMIIVGTINAVAQPGQAALVNMILSSGVPTVAVALRLPYDLAAYPTAPTYACTYSILPTAIEALTQALWGRIPFSGRLPVSIPGLYRLGHGISTDRA
jgi:beta-N-acetylhexosaminidase